jgi:hypothetical protein
MESMADDHANADETSLSPTDLQRLRAAAQARGRLALDDLKRILPIERLSPEQVARVVAQIEDAAIDIEIDLGLMRPSRKAAPTLASGFRLAADGQDAAYAREQPIPPAREAVGPALRTPMLAAPVPDNRRVTAMTIGLVVLVCAILGYIASLVV